MISSYFLITLLLIVVSKFYFFQELLGNLVRFTACQALYHQWIWVIYKVCIFIKHPGWFWYWVTLWGQQSYRERERSRKWTCIYTITTWKRKGMDFKLPALILPFVLLFHFNTQYLKAFSRFFSTVWTTTLKLFPVAIPDSIFVLPFMAAF